jgi:isoleucyl-tRNA synthetase
LLDYPKTTLEPSKRSELLNAYETLLSFRTDVLSALESARANKVIGSSQEALVEIKENSYPDVEKLFTLNELSNICVVSEIKYSNVENITVSHHQGHFCERCWNYEDDAVMQEDGTYLCKRCQKVVGK